jgi:serine O-acetyltransferase
MGGSTATDADTRSASELSLLELLSEDLATYDRRLTEPGLWAVLAHRIGARARTLQKAPLRALARRCHRALAEGVDLVWGIRVAESTELGRRVRIWHSGCVQLDARAIGDDVHIRHDTTLGGVRVRDDAPEHWPTIESRVDLGVGVCVLGPVRVGHDSFVAANSLVLKSVAPHSTVLGVPARAVPL